MVKINDNNYCEYYQIINFLFGQESYNSEEALQNMNVYVDDYGDVETAIDCIIENNTIYYSDIIKLFELIYFSDREEPNEVITIGNYNNIHDLVVACVTYTLYTILNEVFYNE